MKETHTINLEEIHATRKQALIQATTEVARVVNKLSLRQKPWNREHRDTDAYYETFRCVLPGEDIVSTLRHLKKTKPEGEKFVVMDIMGTGSVFENLPENAKPDIIIAMTLVDYRTSEQKVADEKKNIFVIGTDKDDPNQTPTSVALAHTWTQFEDLRKNLGIEHIDFAVARPLGGMHTIPAGHMWFLGWMAQKVYKHLNPQGGIFLTEAPQNQNENMLAWSQRAVENGLDVLCNLITRDRDFQPLRAALKITKHPDSPTSLTSIK